MSQRRLHDYTLWQFATAFVIQVQSLWEDLKIVFSPSDCSALTTTLWDTQLSNFSVFVKKEIAKRYAVSE